MVGTIFSRGEHANPLEGMTWLLKPAYQASPRARKADSELQAPNGHASPFGRVPGPSGQYGPSKQKSMKPSPPKKNDMKGKILAWLIRFNQFMASVGGLFNFSLGGFLVLKGIKFTTGHVCCVFSKIGF